MWLLVVQNRLDGFKYADGADPQGAIVHAAVGGCDASFTGSSQARIQRFTHHLSVIHFRAHSVTLVCTCTAGATAATWEAHGAVTIKHSHLLSCRRGLPQCGAALWAWLWRCGFGGTADSFDGTEARLASSGHDKLYPLVRR